MKIEIYCQNCNHEEKYDNEYEAPFECPKCKHNVYRSRFITCEHCGRELSLNGFTNECVCGTLYNAFGQLLTSPEEWDEEDRYGTFGPQNEEY